MLCIFKGIKPVCFQAGFFIDLSHLMDISKAYNMARNKKALRLKRAGSRWLERYTEYKRELLQT